MQRRSRVSVCPTIWQRAIAGWDAAASQEGLFDESHELSKLIGRPTTPLTVPVADALGA